MSSQARSTLRLITSAEDGGSLHVTDEQTLSLRLDGFAWEALEEQSAELGVPVEELATHAVLYYLADLDSGRIAREAPAT